MQFEKETYFSRRTDRTSCGQPGSLREWLIIAGDAEYGEVQPQGRVLNILL